MNYIPYYEQHRARVNRLLQEGLISESDCAELFENLADHICKWEKKESPKNKLNYYFTNLFSLVKKVFDLQLKYDIKHPENGHLSYGIEKLDEVPHPKVLVQLVGFSVEPLVLSALAINPTEQLILFYSKETEEESKDPLYQKLVENNYKPIIKDEIIFDNNNICLINSSDPKDIFNTIEIVTKSYNANDVAIDITGGKKNMISCAFLSAVIKGFTIYYVDHEEYFLKKSVPFPGTEYLSKIEYPLSLDRIAEIIKDKSQKYPDIGEEIIKKINEPFKNIGVFPCNV